jgi:alpha-amylase
MIMDGPTTPVPDKFHFSFLLHAHQPVGNFEEVFERCYQRHIFPFSNNWKNIPNSAALHYSGTLLSWIENHPEYFELLRYW